MGILTVEGIVENGQIRWREAVTLPEKARVYVIVPGADAPPPPRQPRIHSPRLAHAERASQFAKHVTDVRWCDGPRLRWTESTPAS